MNGKILGTILGAVGVVFWFMPFAQIHFMDMDLYQTGQSVGGIAYLLLVACVLASALSWIGMQPPRIIVTGIALAVCLMFHVQAGASALWGLYGLTAVSAVNLAAAIRDHLRSMPVKPRRVPVASKKTI